MFVNKFQQSPWSFLQKVLLAIFCALTFLTFAAVANGQVEGYTEPFRTIDLSSDESGAIAEMKVDEGDHVSQGDVIARLDDRLQKVQLEIAAEMASASSQLDAAKKTLEKRKLISERFRQMHAGGHANEAELIRSDMELSIAEAKYKAAREESAVRAMELRRAEIQYSRRSISAPMSGIVSKVHRREGEFLSPLRPEVVTIIQVDRLLATFDIPASQAGVFRADSEFEIIFENGKRVIATVHSVSVSTEASSQTVKVKLIFDNPGLHLRAGEICTLNI